MQSPYQLICYINIFKAQCKSSIYQRRKTKRYNIPNTKEYIEYKNLHTKLAELMMVVKE